MSRAARVYWKDRLAGVLEEIEAPRSEDRREGVASPGVRYRFTYDPSYLESGEPISLTLPLHAEPHESETLFPFFAGLVPEGWYLGIVAPTLKVDEQDTFGLLLETCGECVGAVHLQKAHDDRAG